MPSSTSCMETAFRLSWGSPDEFVTTKEKYCKIRNQFTPDREIHIIRTLITPRQSQPKARLFACHTCPNISNIKHTLPRIGISWISIRNKHLGQDSIGEIALDRRRSHRAIPCPLRQLKPSLNLHFCHVIRWPSTEKILPEVAVQSKASNLFVLVEIEVRDDILSPGEEYR